jgi:hypothetical protein
MRLLLAALVLAAALAVGSSTSPAQGANGWPASFEHSFLASFRVTSGGQLAACRCELRWLEQRYTYRQISTIFLRDRARLMKIVTRAALACRR